uniref:non-specific serine/threonine protein kinase n=1 Tax=Oryza glaberrima TaxID=4538 RepID=I1PSR4_ORYGL
KVTGLNRVIVSKKSLADPAAGLYCLELDPTGANQYVLEFCNSSIVYWSTGEWNGQFFNSIPEMSGRTLFDFKFINNNQEKYFVFNLLEKDLITVCFLDISGQMKQLLWLENKQEWATIYTLPKDLCDIYATCGPFTVCNSNALQVCDCIKGFSVRSPKDWELEDRAGGCIRNTPLDCGTKNQSRTATTDKFYSLPGIGLPTEANIIEAARTADQCALACQNNCSCTAYSYATVIWRYKRKQFTAPTNNVQGGNGIVSFKYSVLQHATKNFSEKLGEGGFGAVFKGFLGGSTPIAVKKLGGDRQSEKQFRAENHTTILNWSTRYQIALGVARGLAYLHESCRDCIIHCDIKPENILLDGSFVPKIADFGMAKFVGRDFSRRNSCKQDTSDDDHAAYFPVQVANELLEGDVRSLLDNKLLDDVNLDEAERISKVACWCVQENESNRPTMGEVVQIVEGSIENFTVSNQNSTEAKSEPFRPRSVTFVQTTASPAPTSSMIVPSQSRFGQGFEIGLAFPARCHQKIFPLGGVQSENQCASKTERHLTPG